MAKLQSARRAVSEVLNILLDNPRALRAAIERAETVEPAEWAINPNVRNAILRNLYLFTESRVDPHAGTAFRREFEEMERDGRLKLKPKAVTIPGMVSAGRPPSYMARTR